MNAHDFIHELPPSQKPWHLSGLGGSIYLINEDHPPHVFEDGELKVMPLLFGMPVMVDPALPPDTALIKDRHGNMVGAFMLSGGEA